MVPRKLENLLGKGVLIVFCPSVCHEGYVLEQVLAGKILGLRVHYKQYRGDDVCAHPKDDDREDRGLHKLVYHYLHRRRRGQGVRGGRQRSIQEHIEKLHRPTNAQQGGWSAEFEL